MSSKAKSEQVGTFIVELEKEECLWNVKIRKYKDRNDSSLALKRMSETLHTTRKFGTHFSSSY